MAETLRRSVGGLARETCLVLFLVVLRVSLHALCVSYMMSLSFGDSDHKHNGTNSASSSDDDDNEISAVGELMEQLPHGVHPTDFFVLFLEKLERIFPFLIQVSIFLLPRDFATFSRSQATSGGGPNGLKLPSLSQTVGGPSAADSSVRQFVDKLLSFRFVNKLDWTNCCTFHVLKSRGPVAQAPPPWPVTCTAAYHVACVTSDMVFTDDFDKEGPHFSDWRYIREELGGRSMIAIPMCSCKHVVAVFGMASSVKNAFRREDMAWVMASLLSPYINKLLQFSTRRSEMRLIVNEIISPLASQISKCMTGEKERAKEEQTLFRKDRGKKRSSVSRAASDPRGLVIPEGSATPSRMGSNGGSGNSHEISCTTDDDPEEITTMSRSMLNFCVPSYAKKSTRFSFDHVCLTDFDLNWGDLMFNLVNLCFVYVCSSKAAMHGQTYVAIMLCFVVATFDVFLLVLRWYWVDQAFMQGGLIMHFCQLYRVIVVPLANTWMLWKVLNNLEFESDFSYVIILASLVVLCILLGFQFPFLLQTPLQILSIVFAVVSTPALCHRFDPVPSYPIICLGSISAIQMVVAYLIPTVMLQMMTDSKRGDAAAKSGTAMPHLQVKRMAC